MERLIYRLGVVDRLKMQTLDLRNRIAPLLGDRVPRWGRGRVDTFNPYKAIQFNWPLERLPLSERIGASDFPSLWNQKPREGMQLHWDGDNDSVDERNLSAGLGAGITPVTADHAGIKRVRDWIWTLPPPKYPYPIDAALRRLAARRSTAPRAPRATAITGSATASSPGARLGQVEPIERIGTDRHRLDSYTEAFAANQYPAVPGFAVPVHALPQDARVCEPSARRHLGAGAVSAQRIGADAARSARRPGARGRRRSIAGYDVFDQVEGRVRLGRGGGEGPRRSRGSTRRCPATATAGTSTAPRSRTPRRRRSSST